MTLDVEGRRTRLLGLLGLLLLGAGALLARRWPSGEPALDCPPEQVRWVDGGEAPVAVCGAGDGTRAPAAMQLAVGRRLDLNRATEVELGLIPGVGPTLARSLVEARTRSGGFRTWDEVDSVTGVGPGRLESIRSLTILGTFEGPDGGVL